MADKLIAKLLPARENVYRVIDGERDYQDGLGDGCQKSVGDYLTLLSAYLARARHEYAYRLGFTMALHEVRKVAALAVRCMEEHGAPEREQA